MSRLQPILTWTDAGGAASVASFVLLFFTALAAWVQIRSQQAAQRRQAAFETYRHFSENFTEIAMERSRLKEKFETGEKGTNRREIKALYERYWALQIAEWEMFRARLLPLDVYASWLCYVHDNICGDDQLCYREGRAVRAFTNAEAFKSVALNQMMRSQPLCRDFFERLAAVGPCAQRKLDASNDKAITDRLEAIRELLREELTMHKKQKVWR